MLFPLAAESVLSPLAAESVLLVAELVLAPLAAGARVLACADTGLGGRRVPSLARAAREAVGREGRRAVRLMKDP